MQDEIKVWLEDTERAIAEINVFVPEPRNFFEFERDTKTKRAVERNIEIDNWRSDEPNCKSKPRHRNKCLKKIVDTRNRIIHGYDSVSDDIIWLIIIRYLPVLETEIKKIKSAN